MEAKFLFNFSSIINLWHFCIPFFYSMVALDFLGRGKGQHGRPGNRAQMWLRHSSNWQCCPYRLEHLLLVGLVLFFWQNNSVCASLVESKLLVLSYSSVSESWNTQIQWLRSMWMSYYIASESLYVHNWSSVAARVPVHDIHMKRLWQWL